MINESINETKYLPTSSDVKFSFYAWADSKQMPLRSVMINFGDSTTHKNNNISLSNYKPYCDVATNCVDDMNVPCKEDFADFCSDSSLGSGCVNNSASDPNGYNTFGSQSQYGCVADTYNVSTKYTCDVSNYLDINGQVDEDILNASPNAYDDNNKNKGGVALLKQNPDTNFAYEFELTPVARTYGLTEDDLVCVYYPRVQVADNWGWCTGNCEDTDNGRGCYEDSGYNQCSSSTALSWLYNGGVYDVDSANPIIIIPSKSTTENEEDGNEFD